MSGRKPNALEQKLHQAALADPKKSLTREECEALAPDPEARKFALNFLLATGLFKLMKDEKGVSFRAVMKKELEVKKDMSAEEAMILNYIQASGNEGIWTKHLKAKTELHQTVIDRCLKSLTQKQLVKSVKSVEHPTRKIYMLFHLEPSVKMTGGPWYTDNELDSEFIKLLCNACNRFVRDRSMPKQKGTDGSAMQLLYPISAAPEYPTAQQILTFLSKSRITETQLTVEHVEMLLNVLILDGEIERVPAFGAAMWDTADNARSDESDADRGAQERKRKRKGRSRDDSVSPKQDRKRSKRSRSSDSDGGSDSDSDDDRERRAHRKKSKSKSRSRVESSDDEVERKKRKKTRARDASDDDAPVDKDVDTSEPEGRSRSRRTKGRRPASSSESSDSDEEVDRRVRLRSKAKSKSTTRRKRSESPAAEDVTASFLQDQYGAYVYRAVRQERAAGGGGGIAQTPCVRCPTFEFCKDAGPVNPRECTYYTGWLAANVVKE